MATVTEKYCPYCEKTLPAEAFYVDKAQPSGLSSYCKRCTKAKQQSPASLAKRRARRALASTNHRIGAPLSLPRDTQGQVCITEKYCPQCEQTKAVSAFHKNASQPDGLHGWCKACRNAIHKRPEEQEKRSIAHRKWYVENQQHCLDYAAEWRLENPERAKEIDQRYMAIPAHKTKKNAQRRIRYQKDSSKAKATYHRRRARKKNAPLNDLTKIQWRAILKHYGYRCVYCGTKFPANKLTMDHLTPLCDGGSHTVNNVVPACKSCNSKKGPRAVLVPVQPLLLI